MRLSLICFTILALCNQCCWGFYIPGLNPIAYEEGAIVPINVNGLHSVTNVIPYDYYDAPFCRPVVVRSRHESIGEMLSGENIKSSPYFVNMLHDAKCSVLNCPAADTVMTSARLKMFESLIEKNYRAKMVIDNLPAFNNGTAPYQGRCAAQTNTYNFLRGWAVGVPKQCTGKDTLLNNHLQFRIQYHRVAGSEASVLFDEGVDDGVVDGHKKKNKKNKKKTEDEEEKFLVVGVTVEPFSIKWGSSSEGVPQGCDDEFNPFESKWEPLRLSESVAGSKITWTYGVEWVEEPSIRWAGRWDSYLHTSVADSNDNIHWIGITNSILIVMSLLSMVSLVILRALRKDIAKYNAIIDVSKNEQSEAQADEAGWKVVNGDVFRAPKHADLFTVVVASGTQVASMVFVCLVVACAGFASPANRGGLMTILLISFVTLAGLSGYVAARLRMQLTGAKSWLVIFQMALFLPSIVVVIFLTCNFILRSVRSSGAMPLLSLLVLLGLWIFVSIPLALVGASYGFKAPTFAFARKVNPIPRPIDPSMQPVYLDTRFIIATAGLLPFSVLFLELKFILASLWQGMVYYVFGFLAVVFGLWALTTSLTSIVVVYHRLCAENYHWWWISFLAPSSLGFHLYGFLTYYFYAQLNIQSSAATAIYFLYMALATALYVLCSGAVGFFSSTIFVQLIYSSVKID